MLLYLCCFFDSTLGMKSLFACKICISHFSVLSILVPNQRHISGNYHLGLIKLSRKSIKTFVFVAYTFLRRIDFSILDFLLKIDFNCIITDSIQKIRYADNLFNLLHYVIPLHCIAIWLSTIFVCLGVQ